MCAIRFRKNKVLAGYSLGAKAQNTVEKSLMFKARARRFATTLTAAHRSSLRRDITVLHMALGTRRQWIMTEREATASYGSKPFHVLTVANVWVHSASKRSVLSHILVAELSIEGMDRAT